MHARRFLVCIFAVATFFFLPSFAGCADLTEGPNRPVLTAADVPTVAKLIAASERPLKVSGGNFSGQSFAGVHLADICFENTDFSNSDWSRAVVRNVTFLNSTMVGAKFTKARFQNDEFVNSKLDDVDASDADFGGSKMFDGSFDGLSLRRARLTGLVFACEDEMTIGGHLGEICQWPDKNGIDGRWADMTGATIVALGGSWKTDGVILDRTEILLGDAGAFRNAQVRGPVTVRDPRWFGLRVSRVELSPTEWTALVQSWQTAPLNPRPTNSTRQPAWLRPGADALFASWDLPVSDVFRRTDLYQGLIPVIVRSSRDYLRVHVNDDKSITVEGGSKGGGDHFCDVEGTLKYNPKTGWFGAVHHDDWLEYFPEGKGKIEDVLQFDGDFVEVEGAAPDETGYTPEYVTCGARASFDAMHKLPAAKFLAERAGKPLWD